MRRLLTSIAVAAGLMLVAPAAEATLSANLSLVVSFYANGTITVTLPDGTPIGTTGGSPTQIPAGFYQLLFSGPGGCSALPYFHLIGPGTSITTNMNEGASQKTVNTANFLPSSTYVWTDDAFPGVSHTFVTSAVVEGSPPSPGTGSGGTSPGGKGVSYPSLVGSDILPSRGMLAVGITAAGRLTLAYKGKSVARLKPGKYLVTVTDRSSSRGFVLQKKGHAPITLTTMSFMGKRAKAVGLTAGRWFFGTSSGKPVYSLFVG